MSDAGSAKIRIKVGNIEVEYEGNHEFLKEGLSDLLEDIGNLTSAADFEEDSNESSESEATNAVGQTTATKLELSTNSIATHYNSKSASDLVLAAIIQLQLVAGQDSCTKDEIVKSMKSATNFYKVNMRGSNLTNAFKTLVNKKKINELANEKYALTSQIRQAAETELAGIG